MKCDECDGIGKGGEPTRRAWSATARGGCVTGVARLAKAAWPSALTARRGLIRQGTIE